MNSNTIIEKCQLCKTTDELSTYKVSPATYAENDIAVCPACLNELSKGGLPDSRYWRFLTEAMWSEVQPVQVLSYRILTQLKQENWAADCLDLLYLDDETLRWAKTGIETEEPVAIDLHRDSLGNELQGGDTVILTRTLDVKGSSLNAKMGTAVKNIKLVVDNTDQVEGKIDGQTIVILTKYLRKQKNS